jgi:hypothetical protein
MPVMLIFLTCSLKRIAQNDYDFLPIKYTIYPRQARNK